MKNHFTTSLINLLLGLCFASLTPLIAESQIVSSPGGGLWSSGSTWVGGIVPGAADNVVIVSTVSVNGNTCNNINVASGGILQNHTANNYALTVNGNLTNDGTMRNNTSYSLLLFVVGNFSNNGTMTNGSLTLSGSGNQQLASTQPMSISNFTKNQTSGRAIATTGLNFVGTNISLSSDTLQFTTGNTLTISGGNLSSGVLYKSSLPALQITSGNGTYAQSLIIDAPQTELFGTLLIYVNSNNFKNNVINNGILQNQVSNNYTLTVSGNFTNNGTVQNNYYNFNLNISGNLANNGTWTNQTTTLNGTGNQGIAMSQPFNGSSLVRNASTGRVRATTELNFIGTNITLNSDTLEFTTGNSISINGGSLNSGVLFKSSLPAVQITADNGAYMYAMRVDATQSELNGTMLINGNTNSFKNNVINNGILENYSNNNYTLTVSGNFTNTGTVQNNYYDLNMYISGNLTNNGTWTNQTTTLNGTANQGMAMSQPFAGTSLIRLALAGRVRATSSLSFVGTAINFNSDTLEFTTGNALTMSGGYLSSCVLYKSSLPALQFTSDNFTYVSELILDSPQSELNGVVLISGNSNIFRNQIINYGTLQNRNNNVYFLTVTGSFTNNGIVQNNYYNFSINISGNLANNGTWTNETTSLNGTANQGLAMTQPFSGVNLIRPALAGRVRATTGISFVGTVINFNADTLEFTTGNTMAMSGGNLNSCVLYKASAPAFQFTSGSGNYLSGVTIDSPQAELYGTVQISSSNCNFKNNITNFGILQNRAANVYILPVNGNFTNNGNIQNNYYNFTLNISGNVTNNSSWRNYQTTLTGTSTHLITFTERFEGDYFTNGNSAGSMTATNDLIFDGTTIDLNNCSFSIVSGGRLSILNGGLANAVISGSDIHFHSLGAYCMGTVFTSDVTLQGVFQAGSGVIFNGSVINDGVMRSRGNNTYGIQVLGAIYNNGSITDNYYNFTITVLGDIHNNGVWSNYLTILDKISDQNIFLINGCSIQGQIRIEANFTGSSFAWWGPQGNLVGNANFSGANTQNLNFLHPVTDAYAGQYYCVNNTGVHSRNVFIQSQVNPVRILTLNLLLEGLYNANGIMYPSRDAYGAPIWSSDIADQITVELHDNGNFSNIVFTKEEVLLSTNGVVTFAVPAAYSGNYYIAIRHRSGIITSSATPVSFTIPQINYSFDLANKAYGNNMALMPDGWFALYGGDVNQDGIVDTADMTPVDNGSAAYLSGYRNPDANGDGIIDTADMTLVDNNSANYVAAVNP
jgi:hypothetical protein